MIKIENVWKKYRVKRMSFYALKDISFEIEEGDRLALIGSNGAGKSTLLKVLSQITPPTKGCIHLQGRLCSLLELGAGFHPDLSGRDNIWLNGAILGLKKRDIQKRFDKIVDFAEVEEFLEIPIKRYSSGMLGKLGFAIASHVDPEIFIVDEGLSVGDQAFQKKCADKMKCLADEGKTILFVSHQSSLVKSICNRAVHLEQGEIKNIGSVEECLTSYVNNSVK